MLSYFRKFTDKHKDFRAFTDKHKDFRALTQEEQRKRIEEKEQERKTLKENFFNGQKKLEKDFTRIQKERDEIPFSQSNTEGTIVRMSIDNTNRNRNLANKQDEINKILEKNDNKFREEYEVISDTIKELKEIHEKQFPSKVGGKKTLTKRKQTKKKQTKKKQTQKKKEKQVSNK